MWFAGLFLHKSCNSLRSQGVQCSLMNLKVWHVCRLISASLPTHLPWMQHLKCSLRDPANGGRWPWCNYAWVPLGPLNWTNRKHCQQVSLGWQYLCSHLNNFLGWSHLRQCWMVPQRECDPRLSSKEIFGLNIFLWQKPEWPLIPLEAASNVALDAFIQGNQDGNAGIQ